MGDRALGETVQVSGARRHAYLVVMVVLPPLILIAAVAATWGRAIGPLDVLLALAMYTVNIFGISVGYHRLLTHRSFRCPRPVRVAFALAGATALQGPPSLWAAEHRRHHKYSDKPGDPHSPWAYGDTGFALLRGLLHAQAGWFYSARQRSNRAHWVPDLLADPDIRRVDKAYPAITAASFLLPAVAGGLLSGSWTGFWTALFWAGLVRYAVVHHVTWSVNSIAHCFGDRAFPTRDRSSNVRWVALLTFGEGWHNWHHMEPTSARHGVLKGQADPSAALIRLLEKLGCAHDVHWPSPARIEARTTRHHPQGSSAVPHPRRPSP
ncbi:acyl-CoA desaturase [Actinomadura sp. GC306]|uniref:acyl-CoA desaturase n=1 Tax=Actinomadura sp. GC306 TaxID=2530367 RepID=UPI0010460D8E|nr:acyl-CoA desaturase [Actinomadura sp. GC306]TDC62310.1 acyl-CoA desaturase [Actinomadura sp. GC306]